MKRNPVFHLTAITHRKDALFQTVTIGGKHLGRTDTAQLTTVKTESAAWAGLVTAVREPVACFATPSSGGMYNVRVSIRQRVPGEARNAIAAVFGSMAERQAGVSCSTTTSTCSPTSSATGRWRRATGRPRHDSGCGLPRRAARSVAGGARTGAKIGFDCTIPFGKRNSLEWGIPMAPVMPTANGHAKKSVADTLAAGPASFLELMIAAGSRDGRENWFANSTRCIRRQADAP